jgi:hypothetical protein
MGAVTIGAWKRVPLPLLFEQRNVDRPGLQLIIVMAAPAGARQAYPVLFEAFEYTRRVAFCRKISVTGGTGDAAVGR